MSLVKPISSRRSMVHRLMINPPILPSDSKYVHKGTAVQISRSTDFTKQDEMLVNKTYYTEDKQDILTIKNTIMVSPDEVVYARYAYILGLETEQKGNYKQEKWSRMSSTHGNQIGFKFDDNILATPQVVVSDHDDQVGVPRIKVELAGYKVLIGSIGTHKYTTWEFTDTDNNIIYSRIKDEDNLTSILISKDLFEANKMYFIRAKVYNSFNGESNYGTCIYNTGISTNVSYKIDILKPVCYGESINMGFEVFTPNVTGVKIIIREANGDFEIPVDIYSKTLPVSNSLTIDFEDLYNTAKGSLLKIEGTYKFYAQLEYNDNGKTIYGTVDYIETIRLARKELYPNRVTCDYTGNYYSLDDIELGPVVVNSREFKDGTFVLGINTHKVNYVGEYTNELTLYARHGKQIRSTSIRIPLPMSAPMIAQGNNNLPVVNILPMYTDMVIVNYATFDLTAKNYKRSVWVLYKVNLVTFTFTYLTHSVFEDEFLSTAESSSAVITKNNEVLYVPHGYGTFSKTQPPVQTKAKGIIPNDTIDSLPVFYSSDLVGLVVTSFYNYPEDCIYPSKLPMNEMVGKIQLQDYEDLNNYFLAKPTSVNVKSTLTTQTGENEFNQVMTSINVFKCEGKVQNDNSKKLGVIKLGNENLQKMIEAGKQKDGITIDFFYSAGNNILDFLRERTSGSGRYVFEDINFLSWGEDSDSTNFKMYIDTKKTVKSIYTKLGKSFPSDNSNDITINSTELTDLKAVRDFEYYTYCKYKSNGSTEQRVDLQPYKIYYSDASMPLPRVTITVDLSTDNTKRGIYTIYGNGNKIGEVGTALASNVEVIPTVTTNGSTSIRGLYFKGHLAKQDSSLRPQPVNVYFNSVRLYDTKHDDQRVKEGDQSESGVLPGTLGRYTFNTLPLLKLQVVKDTKGPKPSYKLVRSTVKDVIKQNIAMHMTIVPNRGQDDNEETYLILGGTSEAKLPCTNGPGGKQLPGMYYYELENLDVLEYDPKKDTLTTLGKLPEDIKTFDRRYASFYNISAQRRFDGKIVLFNNSAYSRYEGLSTNTTTWLLDPAKANQSGFLVNENNDTKIDFPFRSTVVRNNGDMLRIAYSTTQQCPVLCYPADPTMDGVIDSDIANKHLIVKKYQRIAIDNAYAYESITIEGDSLENTGTLTWIDATRTRTFNCFDRIITRDLTETQTQADSKKKERLYVLDNVKYKITKG